MSSWVTGSIPSGALSTRRRIFVLRWNDIRFEWSKSEHVGPLLTNTNREGLSDRSA